ncbi:MAG: ABC transporter ATP-binding protein [Epsilonproteobacteria bacterium]|nr:MAG: ABC transporter ATP-binding protein [Campylobacterota bacterium]
MLSLLIVKNLNKSYGNLKVTDDLSFNLKEGEALGIVGPNGAGKTTLFNLISGDAKADGGTIHLAGENISSFSPEKRCHKGIGRTYQIPRPFEGMSVFENVLTGALFGTHLSKDDAEALAISILENTGLINKAEALAGTLSLLERKRLELAKALATQPKILLLDEIAGGLTEHEVQELIGTIKNISKSGISIIWIEHIVHALLSVVDKLVAINFGSVLLEGDPHEVMNSKEVKEVYMGIDTE